MRNGISDCDNGRRRFCLHIKLMALDVCEKQAENSICKKKKLPEKLLGG